MKLFKVFVTVFMSLTLIIGFTQPLIAKSENISEKVLRLHILANSDSTQDQNLKLKVKNEILNRTSDIFTGKTLQENINIANDNKDKIAFIAKQCIEKEGCGYDVNVSVVKEYFDTRVYDDFTLPAGVYNSLKIEIGEAQGHNWWCIIFPSVCLNACTESISDYLTEEEMELVSNSYTPKFKIIEIYEKFKSKLVCKG